MNIRNDLRSVAFPVASMNVQKAVVADSFEAVRGFGGSGSGNSGSGSSGSGNKSKKAASKAAPAAPVQQCSVPTPAKAGAVQQTPAQAQVGQLPAKASVPAPATTKVPEAPVAIPGKL